MGVGRDRDDVGDGNDDDEDDDGVDDDVVDDDLLMMMVLGGDARQRQSLASGQKMIPPIFPAEETSFDQIYRRGQGEKWRIVRYSVLYICLS